MYAAGNRLFNDGEYNKKLLHTVSLSASTGGLAHNLLIGSSFEQPLTGWSFTGDAGAFTCHGEKVSGLSCLRVEASAVERRYAAQSVTLEAGTYTLSGYARIVGSDGTTGVWLEAVEGSTVLATSHKQRRQHGMAAT